MKEKIKYGIKKTVLGSIIKLYGLKTKYNTKKASKYKESEQNYREALKYITRDKSMVMDESWKGLKNGFKKLGQQIILDYLIASDRSKASKYAKKSSACERKKQEYANRLEELSRPKPENTGNENRLENIISTPTNPSPEIIANKGYHASMEDLYKKYEAANDTLTSTIGKILAGDYIENGKRIWYWKDRVRKVREYLGNNQLSEPAQRQIFAILKKDHYFMSKKYNEISELNNTLFRETGINSEIREYLSNRTRQPTTTPTTTPTNPPMPEHTTA